MQCVTCGERISAAERKYSGPCVECGAVTCPKHTVFYVDESNIAITGRARPKCLEHGRTA